MTAGPASADALDALIEGQLRCAWVEREAWPTTRAPAPAADPVTIVVPVHNGLALARRCLDALLAHTGSGHRIVVVDDASTDPGVSAWLDGLAGSRPNLEVRRNPRNLGYLATANELLACLPGDIVLLNSDTEVAPGWLDALARVARRPGVGIACPVTDQAGPLGVFADVPDRDLESCAARARATAGPGPVALPVAVGFCMYLRRPMLDAVGLFDVAFSPGYGEENELSMRAWRAGFAVMGCPDALVLHAGGASFGDGEEIRRRRALHARLLASRWPGHDSRIRDWWRDWPLRPQATRLATATESGRPRLLHLLHAIDRLGGTEIHTAALARALAGEFDSSLLAPQDLAGQWTDQTVEQVAGIRVIRRNGAHIRPNQRLHGGGVDLSDPGVERGFLRLLEAGAWPLVHVHSLLNWNSLLLPELARRAGCRVVLSLHSLEAVCADFTLVPPALGNYCGHRYGGDDPACETCLAPRLLRRRGVQAPSPAALLASRRHAWKRIAQGADAVVAPSRFALDRVASALGIDFGHRGVVVPHGLPAPPAMLPAPDADAPFTVGFLAGGSRAKGFDLVMRLAADPALAHLSFRIHGRVDHALLDAPPPPNIQFAGPYRPDRIGAVLAPLDLVLLPSQSPETFSIALSECRAAAVPVLASRAGALAERVADGVDGWLLPAGDPAPWRDRLLQLSGPEGRDRLRRVREHLQGLPVRTLDDNAAAYGALYRQLLATPRPRPAAAAPTVDLASRRLLTDAPMAAPDAGHDLVADRPGTSMPAFGVLMIVDSSGQSGAEPGRPDPAAPMPGIEWLVMDRGRSDGVERDTLLARLREDDRRWWLLLEAGDTPLPGLSDLLADADPDVEVLLPDLVLADGEGRCHAVQQAPASDRLLALSGAGPPAGVCVRGRLFETVSAHGLGSVALPYALLLAALRAGRRVDVPNRIGVRRDDRHLSTGQSDAVLAEHRRQADLFRGAQDLAGAIVGNADSPGWRFRPDPAPRRSVAIRIHGPAAGAVQAALERQRESVPGTRIDCGILSHHPLPAGCERVVIVHAGAHALGEEELFQLLGWLEFDGIALVAPRRVDLSGNALACGWRFDGHRLRAIPAPESATGCDPGTWAPVSRSFPGLVGTCLALRAEGVTERDLIDLADPDPSRSFLAQQRWRIGGNLLWVPEPTLRQAGADPSSVDVPPGVRRVLGAQGLDRRRPAVEHRRRPTRGAGPEEGPLRVAAVTRDFWAPSRYRIDLPLADLAQAGEIAAPAVWRHGLEPLPSLFELAEASPDVVLFHDAYDDAALELMLALKRQLPGARRLVVIDDLVTDLPPWHPGRGRVDPALAGRVGQLCATADLLVVTTPGLKSAFGDAARFCTVIGNGLPERPWLELADLTAASRIGRSGAPVRVGWAGAQQHAGDLALLDEIVAARPRLDWQFLGMAPPAAPRLGLRARPMVPFDAYPGALASMALDIALVPLAAHPFNDCKSTLKLQEFGFLGTAVIASDRPAYREAPVVRVEDRAQAWLDALDSLVADADRRRREGERLRDWVRAGGLAGHHRSRWLAALRGDAD